MRRTFALDRKIECDDSQLASVYADFADEDRTLAEEGIESFERGLLAEDLGHCPSAQL